MVVCPYRLYYYRVVICCRLVCLCMFASVHVCLNVCVFVVLNSCSCVLLSLFMFVFLHRRMFVCSYVLMCCKCPLCCVVLCVSYRCMFVCFVFSHVAC